jgi:hypothetical protein
MMHVTGGFQHRPDEDDPGKFKVVALNVEEHEAVTIAVGMSETMAANLAVNLADITARHKLTDAVSAQAQAKLEGKT